MVPGCFSAWRTSTMVVVVAEFQYANAAPSTSSAPQPNNHSGARNVLRRRVSDGLAGVSMASFIGADDKPIPHPDACRKTSAAKETGTQVRPRLLANRECPH